MVYIEIEWAAKVKQMKTNLTLHIVLQNPPADYDYGLQKGSGAKYQTVQTQRSVAKDLHFRLDIEVKGDNQKDTQPGFAGKFVQGSPPNKFLYIDIGAYAGQAGAFGGRLKIPLTGITWGMVEEMRADSTLALETCVPGTGKNGSPNCATVNPFAGWKLKKPVI